MQNNSFYFRYIDYNSNQGYIIFQMYWHINPGLKMSCPKLAANHNRTNNQW